MKNISSQSAATVSGILAILFWSATVALSRDLSERLGPLTAGAAVYTIGGALACLPLILRPEGLREILRLPRAYLFVCGGLVVIYTACFCLSVGLAGDRTLLMEVSLINYLWPALTLFFSVPILGNRPRAGLVPGALLALAGIAAAAVYRGGSPSLRGLTDSVQGVALPYFLALAGAVAWALYSNLSRRWAGATERGAMSLFLLASGLFLFALRSASAERSEWAPGLAPRLLLCALLPVALAYPLWDAGMRKGRMTLLAALAYLAPVISTAVASLYLRVPLTAGLWLGCLLVAAGAAVCKLSIVEVPLPAQVPPRRIRRPVSPIKDRLRRLPLPLRLRRRARGPAAVGRPRSTP